MSTSTQPDHTVRSWRRDAVLWIEIDRPETLNAIDFDTIDDLYRAIDQARLEESIHAVVLTGAGDKSFISGGDLKCFAELKDAAGAELMARRMRGVLDLLESLPCFTVACVNGDAYGGGCEVMVACDFRIAARHAKLGWTQTRFALPCGWGGMTRLCELVGPTYAMRWLAEAKILSAEEALALKLIDDLCDADALRERVQHVCSVIARHRRPVIAAIKQGALNASRMRREEAIQAELKPFIDCWIDSAHLDAVEAFLGRAEQGDDDDERA